MPLRAALLLLTLTACIAAGAARASDLRALAEERVREHVLAIMAALPARPTLQVDVGAVARLPPCRDLRPFSPPGLRLASRMSVGLQCHAPTPWTAYVRVDARAPGRQVVAARALQPGDMVSADALTERDVDLLRQPASVVVQPAEALGHVVTRRVAAGRPLRRDALRSADAVTRGSLVTLVLHGQGFTATGTGQATSAGAPGATVGVRMPGGHTVHGIVRDARTVEVRR